MHFFHSVVIAAIVVSVAACGGKVVFAPDGEGGAGGSSTFATSTKASSANSKASTGVGPSASSSTGINPTCNQSCSGDSQKCSCQGQCFGQPVVSQCSLLPSPMCDCVVNGQFVGSCQQPSGNACDLENGCCSQFFPKPG